MPARLPALLLLAFAFFHAARGDIRPPNVILILADDLGYRDLGCQGHPSIRTPVLDKLAAGGLRLTALHAGASVCTPSRMALLSEAYPVRLGWTQGVLGYKMGIHHGMSPDALTLAEIFLYLPYTAPHFPVEAHPDWKGKSAFGAYGDVIEELDARIGDLLATVSELGLEKETLVVFTSDNGPQKGEQASALPFRGENWSALEGGTRVPCILSWPGVIPVASVSDRLISAIDLLPTISRACGVDWKSRSQGKPVIDGMDLGDALLGKEGAPHRTELLHWHGMHPEPQALRSGDWKIVLTPREGHDKKETKPALYQLRDDPSESKDLAAGHPERVAQLSARLKELHAEIMARPILPISK